MRPDSSSRRLLEKRQGFFTTNQRVPNYGVLEISGLANHRSLYKYQSRGRSEVLRAYSEAFF